ncbi:hypothetical protein [Nocardia gipuzkoensis]
MSFCEDFEMSRSLPEFFPEFKRYHGMFVSRKTFEATCAFLDGYEAGSGHRILKEFHSWLVLRGRGRPELYWPWLVLCEIYEDSGAGTLPDFRYFTPEQDEQAVTVLFDLLGEFLAARGPGNARAPD